jgi:hypothetical protein
MVCRQGPISTLKAMKCGAYLTHPTGSDPYNSPCRKATCKPNFYFFVHHHRHRYNQTSGLSYIKCCRFQNITERSKSRLYSTFVTKWLFWKTEVTNVSHDFTLPIATLTQQHTTVRHRESRFIYASYSGGSGFNS